VNLAGILRYIGVFAYAAGSVVCHQLPERSFYWGQWQFPVCSRCTGLYLSAVVGLAAWAAIRNLRGTPILIQPRVATVVLVAAALPTLVSVATATFGAWDPTNAGRALLAVPLGATTGVLLAAVAAKDLR
jgi:uncharacterized membrane protein